MSTVKSLEFAPLYETYKNKGAKRAVFSALIAMGLDPDKCLSLKVAPGGANEGNLVLQVRGLGTCSLLRDADGNPRGHQIAIVNAFGKDDKAAYENLWKVICNPTGNAALYGSSDPHRLFIDPECPAEQPSWPPRDEEFSAAFKKRFKDRLIEFNLA